jgi:hypothetical protein
MLLSTIKKYMNDIFIYKYINNIIYINNVIYLFITYNIYIYVPLLKEHMR